MGKIDLSVIREAAANENFKADKKSFKEEQEWNQFTRDERVLNVLHYSFIGVILFVGLVFVSALGTWTLHFLLPKELCWLEATTVGYLTEGMKVIGYGSVGTFFFEFTKSKLK